MMTRPYHICLLTLVFTLGLLTGPLALDADESGIAWEQLDAAEQRILQSFSDRWDALQPRQQQRLRKGARRWATLSPEQRDRVKERLKRWQQMTPQQRERARQRFERFRSLPPQEQQRLRKTQRWFQSLPPEQRQELSTHPTVGDVRGIEDADQGRLKNTCSNFERDRGGPAERVGIILRKQEYLVGPVFCLVEFKGIHIYSITPSYIVSIFPAVIIFYDNASAEACKGTDHAVIETDVNDGRFYTVRLCGGRIQ